MKSFCKSATLALCISTCAAVSEASEAEFYVVDQRMNQFFDVVAQTTGSQISVAETVRGRVQHQHFSGSVETIMNAAADTFEVNWFHFNGVYYVSAPSDVVSRVVRLGTLRSDDALDALSESGLDTPALQRSVTAQGQALVLTGPPRLVAFAEIVIESTPVRPPKARPAVRVRRGTSVNTEVTPDT